MLISSVRQSDSVILEYIRVCVCVCIFFVTFFSLVVCHRILTVVPSAMQEDVAAYPSHVPHFASADPDLSALPAPRNPHGSVLWVCEPVVSHTGSPVWLFQISHVSGVTCVLAFLFLTDFT